MSSRIGKGSAAAVGLDRLPRRGPLLRLANLFRRHFLSDDLEVIPRAFASWFWIGVVLLFPALVPAQSILEQQAKMRIDASEGLYIRVGETQALRRTDHKADFYAVVSSLKKAYAVPLCVEYLDPDGTPGFPFVIDAGTPLSATITNLAERSAGAMVATAIGGRLVVTISGASKPGETDMDRFVPQFEPGTTLGKGLIAMEQSYNRQHPDLPMVTFVDCSAALGDPQLRQDSPMGGRPLRDTLHALLEATGNPALTYGVSVRPDAFHSTYMSISLSFADCRDEFGSEEEMKQFHEDLKAQRARLDGYFAAGAETPKP